MDMFVGAAKAICWLYRDLDEGEVVVNIYRWRTTRHVPWDILTGRMRRSMAGWRAVALPV